jgi:arsenate reductase
MAEVGIDLNQNESKHLDRFKQWRFDYVITVCDSAKENCPVWLGQAGQQVHIGFAEPAGATGSAEEITTAFRQVRDEIEERLLGFLRK